MESNHTSLAVIEVLHLNFLLNGELMKYDHYFAYRWFLVWKFLLEKTPPEHLFKMAYRYYCHLSYPSLYKSFNEDTWRSWRALLFCQRFLFKSKRTNERSCEVKDVNYAKGEVTLTYYKRKVPIDIVYSKLQNSERVGDFVVGYCVKTSQGVPSCPLVIPTWVITSMKVYQKKKAVRINEMIRRVNLTRTGNPNYLPQLSDFNDGKSFYL